MEGGGISASGSHYNDHRPGFPGPFPVLVPGKPGQLVTLPTCEQNNRAMCGTAQQASRYQRQVLSKPAWV